jgi:hypothetical protein
MTRILVLCNRFDIFLADNDIIHETQIGFSKKAGTWDHIFVLKCIIDKYLKCGDKKIICMIILINMDSCNFEMLLAFHYLHYPIQGFSQILVWKMLFATHQL